MQFIDAHEDIALNSLYATQKDFAREHSLHQGKSPAGFCVNNNVDLPRLKKGGVKFVFTTLFSLDQETIDELVKNPPANYNFAKLAGLKTDLYGAVEQLAFYSKLFWRLKEKIQLVRTFSDYQEVKKSEKVGFILHSEGVDYFKKVEDLDLYYQFGLRSLALTWRNQNLFGGGNNSKIGLTEKGKDLLERAEKNGVIIDLAHANETTFYDAIKVIKKPCMVSHTNCAAIHPHNRNITDEQIKQVAHKGGIVGMSAIPDHIGGDTLKDYVAHFIHIKKLVGAEHVVFGTDFDGMVDPEDRFIQGFEDVSKFPNVARELTNQGFSEEEIDLVAFKNMERLISDRLKN